MEDFLLLVWGSMIWPNSLYCAESVEFFAALLDDNKAASTLKVYVAAISAYHAPVDGASLGSHNLGCSFLKGARRLKPVRSTPFPVWDLPLVLEFLCTPQFEPLAVVYIKWLPLKVSFLLAIASAKRVCELHALSVSAPCLRWLPEDSGVILRPNPAFLPKVLSPQFVNQSIHLTAFQPPLSPSDAGGGRSHLLCPVRALRCYVKSTASLRQTDQLFVCYGEVRKGAPLFKQRLSRWIVEVIKIAYSNSNQLLPVGVTCHSTRAVSSYWAALRGVSLAEVCAAATWSSPCTFAWFYKVNVAASHDVSSAVLQEDPWCLQVGGIPHDCVGICHPLVLSTASGGQEEWNRMLVTYVTVVL